MECQFGTNWSAFSRRPGGVIGQPLAMEGVFSFFLESAFLGLFLFGEKRLSRWAHWGAGFLVFLGSWISGFFIIVTDAWMQHPVAYRLLPNGTYEVSSFWGLMMNPRASRRSSLRAISTASTWRNISRSQSPLWRVSSTPRKAPRSFSWGSPMLRRRRLIIRLLSTKSSASSSTALPQLK